MKALVLLALFVLMVAPAFAQDAGDPPFTASNLYRENGPPVPSFPPLGIGLRETPAEALTKQSAYRSPAPLFGVFRGGVGFAVGRGGSLQGARPDRRVGPPRRPGVVRPPRVNRTHATSEDVVARTGEFDPDGSAHDAISHRVCRMAGVQ